MWPRVGHSRWVRSLSTMRSTGEGTIWTELIRDLLGLCWTGARREKPHFPLYLCNCQHMYQELLAVRVAGLWDSWSSRGGIQQTGVLIALTPSSPLPVLLLAGLHKPIKQPPPPFFFISKFKLGFYHFQINCLFFFFGHTTQLAESQFPDQ